MTTDEHQHQPGVKRKRLSSSRQQAKLERIYARFLERFGPRGLFTPFGVSLVAPKFRDGAGDDDRPEEEAKDYLDGSYGSVIIPEEILRGVAAMRDDWDEDEDEPTHRSSSSSSVPRESAPRPSLNPTTQRATPTAASSSLEPTAIPIHTNSFYLAQQPASSSRKEPEVKRTRIDPRESLEAEKRVKAEGLLASRHGGSNP